VPGKARTPLRRRTGLAPAECRDVWQATAARGARFHARVGTAPKQARRAGVKAARKTVSSPGQATDESSEREDAAVELPFYTDGDGEQGSLLAGLLLVGLGLAFVTMFVLVVRFLRGTWNP
jgi:hypothetical protein